MFKMFELEDYSTGIHDGYLTKYSEPSNPTLDFYISDSMQDMLDVDIRSEIENVVGGGDPGFLSSTSERHFLDQALNVNGNCNVNTNSSCNNSNHTANGSSSMQSSSLGGSIWYGPSSWSSSSNDFYADIGACVNPISVMPLISSTLMHKSSKSNLNSNGLPPPPASPNAKEPSKSHLTFSPAQMKINSNSIRHEQILSHIPKQIVPISSAVTAATTAPATMATNSALQRKVGIAATAVEAIKKDLVSELRRSSFDEGVKNASGHNSNGTLNGATSTNMIKLAPGIGGLTFANSITYNKLKLQTATAKSPLSSPNSSSLSTKRERGSSPLHTPTNNGGGSQTVSKIIARNIVQSANGFTPKSIASAHSPLINSGGSSGSIGSPSSASSMSASSPSSHSSGYNGSFSAGLAPLNGHSLTAASGNLVSMKSLHQKTKAPIIESEYPKPAYSYSCLIAMALKNSRSGSLPVSEIYRFMCEHFPYFNTAPSGWKNSVRHNLSLNKCFEKIEKPATNGNQRKGCLWAMNPERITKMDEEVQKWSRKDPAAIRNAMVYPENLEALERGEMKHGSLADDAEADSQSDIEDTSDLEEPEDIDETIVDSMFVEDDEDAIIATEDIVVMNECPNEDDEVMNDLDEIKHDGDSDIDDKDFIQLHQQQQQQRDFDIEVEDFYDSIDIEDDKEAVRMAINQSDIIELCPADLNVASRSPKRARLDVNYSIGPVNELEKHLQRQRKLEIQQKQQQQQQQRQQQQQQQKQQIKTFRFVQQFQQQTLSQHQTQPNKQQHIIVQTINGNGSITNATMTAKKATNIASIATAATTVAANNNNNNGITSNKFPNNNNNTILTQKQVQHLTQFQQLPLTATSTAMPQHNRRKMQLVNRIA